MDDGLVVGYLKDGKLRESGGEYSNTPLPSVNAMGIQGPVVGFRLGNTIHGLLPGGMHTPSGASS